MRLIAIAFMMFAIMIGVSKLANAIRVAIVAREAPAVAAEPPKPEKRLEVVAAKTNVEAEAMKAEAEQRPLPLKPLPVAMKPGNVWEGAPAAVSREALVASIQTELSRLGYYQGPIDGIWAWRVRAAVRKFALQGNYGSPLVPGEELLQALRRVSTTARAEAPSSKGQDQAGRMGTPARAEMPARKAENAPRKRAVRLAGAETNSATVESTDKDGGSYLPPWMDAARDTQRDVSAAKNQLDGIAGSGGSDGGSLVPAEPGIPSVEGVKAASAEERFFQRKRRREAISTEYRYGRRKNIFQNANFAWPGQ